MEESALRERLIEAADLAESLSGFRLTVSSLGIFVQYVWERRAGRPASVDRFILWDEIENANVNPLVLAMNSMSKEAAALQ